MREAEPRRRLSLTAVSAAVLAAALVAGCASDDAARQAEMEAARVAAEAAAVAARTPPAIALNDGVVDAASIYVAFTRDVAAMEGGFSSPEAIQAALRRGASYDPVQLSRGLVAYASILALQSPEFVQGVRQYAVDRTVREQLVANIVSDPRWASHLPGADAAAGVIMGAMRDEIEALSDAADSIENDAYTIQQSWDPRRSWGVAPVADRQGRLDDAKARSTRPMTRSAPDAARLSSAALSGRGLGTSRGTPRRAPYPPAVERALALAALAALGAAGDDARANTNALIDNPTGEACLSLSKLMLFQCLAASRPSYEDMFCVGRHIVRDIATCTRGAAMPAAIVTTSDLSVVDGRTPTPTIRPDSLEQRRPDIAPAPLDPPRRPTVEPAPSPRPTPPPAAPSRPLSPTERLNTQPGG